MDGVRIQELEKVERKLSSQRERVACAVLSALLSSVDRRDVILWSTASHDDETINSEMRRLVDLSLRIADMMNESMRTKPPDGSGRMASPEPAVGGDPADRVLPGVDRG